MAAGPYRERMRFVRFLRFVGVPTLLVVAVALLAQAGAAPGTTAGARGGDGLTSVAAAYPTNAAKIFRWGTASVKDEFHGPLSSRWAVSASGRGLVRNQHGMLTLNTTPTSGTVTATLVGGDRQYGRWEARVRSRQYTTGATAYTVNWELVPTSGDGCARTISLAQYPIGSTTARAHVRNGGQDFTAGRALDLGKDVFHTYAVEVAPDHVSWFVDTRVVMTERRDQARSGATYRVQLRMQAPAGAVMNRSRMQLDWVRYYTLDRPGARPIEAPQALATAYGGTC
jgi:hypothetical protein